MTYSDNPIRCFACFWEVISGLKAPRKTNIIVNLGPAQAIVKNNDDDFPTVTGFGKTSNQILKYSHVPEPKKPGWNILKPP